MHHVCLNDYDHDYIIDEIKLIDTIEYGRDMSDYDNEEYFI